MSEITDLHIRTSVSLWLLKNLIAQEEIFLLVKCIRATGVAENAEQKSQNFLSSHQPIDRFTAETAIEREGNSSENKPFKNPALAGFFGYLIFSWL